MSPPGTPRHPPPIQNVHGRKWGRGIRPYLLLPKYVCVSIFLGGLVTTLIHSTFMPAPATPEAWRAWSERFTFAYTRVIVPALLGAMTMGVLLLTTHLRAFIRMRWFQAKLALVALGVPTLHFLMRARSSALRTHLTQPIPDPEQTASLAAGLRTGTALVIAWALILIFLGRIKPRLGQDYGRTFARKP